MTRKETIKLMDSGDTVQRVLARCWYDADNGNWPIQNSCQYKTLVEAAIEQYQNKLDKIEGLESTR